MREIKFRQHNKYNPHMVHFSGDTDEGKWVAPIHRPNWGELEQWTGVIDMNGIRIYEGDIIQYHNPPSSPEYSHHAIGKPRVVEWRETTQQVGYNIGKSRYGDRYEVIGNIYENPELLENK